MTMMQDNTKIFQCIKKLNNIVIFSPDINECLLNPCQFGGTCINTVGSFICQCPPGRSGAFCGGGLYK